jgi:hypothetical protein
MQGGGLVVVSSVMDGIFCDAHQKFTLLCDFLARDRTLMTDAQQRSFMLFLLFTYPKGWMGGMDGFCCIACESNGWKRWFIAGVTRTSL